MSRTGEIQLSAISVVDRLITGDQRRSTLEHDDVGRACVGQAQRCVTALQSPADDHDWPVGRFRRTNVLGMDDRHRGRQLPGMSSISETSLVWPMGLFRPRLVGAVPHPVTPNRHPGIH
ncbi:hypothetical protein [Microbacterium sp. UBA837]|uniref:hypothetical protein n=1 Tax=Microbacterium sp. UBA837 TaxID=1946956 RepID=UPI0025FB7089|nr:hypothetical protein [Microbacterium sp. UBA837]